MNENFHLNLHQEESYKSFFSASVTKRRLILHCLLNEGVFIFESLINPHQSVVLTVEVDKDILESHPLYSPNILFVTGPTMTLQLLELLNTLKQEERNDYEIEIMSFALCSTAMAISCAEEKESFIRFKDAENIYNMVQNWKSAETRITEKPLKYKPAKMSHSTFLMLIQQLYNCSPSDLLYEINMQKAMNILLQSPYTIGTISEQSGYKKKENFIAAFRNTYGVTPGRLKKHFR